MGKDGRPSIAGAQLGSHSAGGRRSVQHLPMVAIIQQVVVAQEPGLAQHPVHAGDWRIRNHDFHRFVDDVSGPHFV